ncbi:hypothetical protein [Azospirillum sp. TSH64]|uniref:hypothetical protein n=1 Tax=Azospirillum sp. TSH64 TaxID=652740 RepID=UPI000D618A49|nr:hypothetical protein [Azospirillum sp. TSH64]PWC78121.1 hypothetical protein TSH64_28085 [Azospirillum sp. TSH64]
MKRHGIAMMVLGNGDAAAAASTIQSLLLQRRVDIESVLLLAMAGEKARPASLPDGFGDSVHWVAAEDREPAGRTMARALALTDCRWVGWLRAGDSLDPLALFYLLETQAQQASPALSLCAQVPDDGDAADSGGSDADVQSLLGRILGGRAQSGGLLVPHAEIQLAGGFRSDCLLPEVDMLARLSRRLTVRHVPAAGYRPVPPSVPPAAEPRLWREDRERIAAAWLAQSDDKAPRSERAALIELQRSFQPSPSPDLSALLAWRMSRLIEPGELTVAILGPSDIAASELGVPGARMIRGVASTVDLMAGLASCDSPYVVAVESGAPPAVPTLAGQLLQQLALRSVACFPPASLDHLTASTALVVGTLFRRDALTRDVLGHLQRGEGAFWYALQRRGVLTVGPCQSAAERAGDGLTPRGLLREAKTLVDEDWYAQEYPDRLRSDIDPAAHYLSFGWKEGLNPNPWFLTAWYSAANQLEGGDRCPLLHFIENGAGEGRQPHPHFDLVWYASRYLASKPDHRALRHFLDIGRYSGAAPEPLMNDPWVRRTIQRLPNLRRSAEEFGRLREARIRQVAETAKTLVDRDWYLAQYPDVVQAGVDPFWHYLSHGWKENRSPGPWFSAHWYRDTAMGGQLRDVSPLEHFIVDGATAGLRPTPEFDTVWYSQRYLGLRHPSAEALRHFVTSGLAEGLVPDPALDGAGLRSVLRETPASERAALIRRLWALRNSGRSHAPVIGIDMVEDWALLLLRRKPPATQAVLLLAPDASDAVARARDAARALPLHETALFMVMRAADRIEFRDRMEENAVSVTMTLDDAFHLVRAMNCTRVAAIDPGLLAGPAGAALVSARLTPVINENGA